MEPQVKTMAEHLETGAKYSGSSVVLGLSLAQVLVAIFPQAKEVEEAIQALLTFGINMLLVRYFKG